MHMPDMVPIVKFYSFLSVFRCNNYSDEEIATLVDTFTTIAQYECFMSITKEGCAATVSG